MSRFQGNLIAEELMNINGEELREHGNAIMNYIRSLIPDLVNFAINVCIAILIYIIGKRIISLIRKFVSKMMDKSRLDEGVKQFLDSFLKLTLYFLLIVLMASRFGDAAATVTALVGSAGLAIGLATQGSLANLAGGVLILVLKPFEVGDYIITESGKEGVVGQIQICYTRLTTADNRLIVIPNGKLSGGEIINVTKQEKRRIDFTVNIAYSADLKRAKDILTDILTNDTSRIPEDDIQVFVDHLGDSEVVLGARIWVKTEDFWDSKWRIQERILLELQKEGIEIPFPQMEVTINK